MLRDRRLQPLWNRLSALALRGMNFDGTDQSANGEKWLLDDLAQHLGPSPVVFDVGANKGRYSAAVLEAMPAARLYAFEPSNAAFAVLHANLGQRATTIRLALGAENGERTLYGDAPGSELGSLVRRDLRRHGLAVREIETVTVRRLETICHELSVERIDFLKIDAEGNDLDVLRGAGPLLRGGIGVMQFEFFGGTAVDARQTLRDFFDVLEPSHRMHRLLPRGLWPLEWTERVEIFSYANYVALPQ
jgi:FkbM family methyltransferase